MSDDFTFAELQATQDKIDEANRMAYAQKLPPEAIELVITHFEKVLNKKYRDINDPWSPEW